MSNTIDNLHRLREHFSQEQSEALLSIFEAERQHYVTREYLDARLQTLQSTLTDTLTSRMLGIAGLMIVLIGLVVGLLDRFVRP